MARYNGEDVEAQHGGQWVEDGNLPWESYNFRKVNGRCYGYAQTTMGSAQANLERIDPSADRTKLDGVLVVFFAKHGSQQVIVGWYDGAVVYRDRRSGPRGARKGLYYYFVCPVARAVLLPEEDRMFPIPRGKGGTGQSNWTYVLDDQGRRKNAAWIDDAVAYVRAYRHRASSAFTGIDTAKLRGRRRALEQAGAFDPKDDRDARKKTLSAIVRRQGQPAFREALLEAYGGKCAVTGCEFEPALEAAHVTPYRGEHTNHITNGILLRADIHTLFDLGYVAVDTTTEPWTVVVAPILTGTSYAKLGGLEVHLANDGGMRPSADALNEQRRRAGI